MRPLLIVLLCLSTTWTAYSQYTQIPDPGFEQALIDLGIDSEGVLDGQVLTSDIESIEVLELFWAWFDNLIGLEDFSSLKSLSFYFCSIGYSLDLSMATTLENFYLHGNLDAPMTALHEIYFNNNPNLNSIELMDDWMIQQIDLRGSDQYINRLHISYDPGHWFGGDDPPPEYTTPKICVLVTDPDAVRNREGNYATWSYHNAYFTTDCTLSISNFTASDFKVYPNPTKDFFQIETTADMESISVYDIQGKRIKSYRTNKQNYSVTNLSSGLYFLKFNLKSGGQFMKKIIVD